MGQFCSCKGENEDGERMTCMQAIQRHAGALTYEALGVAFYVFIGCGTTVVAAEQNQPTGAAVSTAFAFAFAATAMIYATSHRSGGHLNPAVTLSFLLTGDVKFWEGISIIVGQMVGALGGCAALAIIIPGENNSLGANRRTSDWAGGYGYWRCIMAEAFCLFFLLMVYYEVAGNKRSLGRSTNDGRAIMAPLVIGLAVYACHAVLIPIDGGSVNPARTVMTAFYGTFRDISTTEKDDIWADCFAILIGHGMAVGFTVLGTHFMRKKGVSSAGDRTALRSASMYELDETTRKQLEEELHNEAGGTAVDAEQIEVDQQLEE